MEEVYNQIVADLEEASKLFAKHPKTRGNYRLNGTTVDILLARAYLYMEEYDKAITAATQAIESAEGLSDYTKMSHGEKEFSLARYDLSEVEWLYGRTYIDPSLCPTGELLTGFTAGDKRRDFGSPLTQPGYTNNSVRENSAIIAVQIPREMPSEFRKHT